MRAQPAWPARLALVLLLLLLSAASLMIWRQLEQDQHERLDERLDYQARSLARQLEGTLHTEVEGLGRIARLFAAGRLAGKRILWRRRCLLRVGAAFGGNELIDTSKETHW